MQNDLRRTHVTPLSDDELILLNVMFDCAVPLRMLQQSVFTDHWNRPSHKLNDDQLCDTMNRFCEANSLASEPDTWRDETCLYYSFTPHGGELWEAERTPVWDRYAMDQYGGRTDSSGRQTLLIRALSATIRDDLWRISGEVGMWSSDIGRVRFWQISRHVLIPWKTFPRIYVAVGKIRDECRRCDLSLYESRRTWWRDVEELQKFL